MKLIYTETKLPVTIGDKIEYVHHNAAPGTAPVTLIVTHITPPHKPGSTGKVYAGPNGRNGVGCYPSVYDMEWIERDDQ